MAIEPPNAEPNSRNKLSIPTYVTMPDGNKYHWIEDGKLEDMMKIPAPISLVISLTCFGYALGDLRNVIALKDKYLSASANAYNLGDVIFFGIFSAALAIGILAGIYWIGSKVDTKTFLQKIRSRTPIPWQQNETQTNPN